MSKITSQIAICNTCGTRWEDYLNDRAKRAGRSHAKRKGHLVTVETVVAVHYDYREIETKQQ